MSTRPGAPYKDSWMEKENVLVYEGHDLNAREAIKAKKETDQPLFERSGSLTDNGKFFKAAHDYRIGRRKPRQIQVYEKVADGIWYDKGCFELMDATFDKDGSRNVFRFFLRPAESKEPAAAPFEYRHERIIPSAVKVAVWKRDRGKCVQVPAPACITTISSRIQRAAGAMTNATFSSFAPDITWRSATISSDH